RHPEQLFLGLFSARDVAEKSFQPDLLISLEYATAVILDPTPLPATVLYAIFDTIAASLFQCIVNRIVHEVPILGMEDLREVYLSGKEFFLGVTRYLLYLVVEVGHRIVSVVAAQIDYAGNVFSKQSEAAFGVAQLVVRLALFADVGCDKGIPDYDIIVVMQCGNGKYNRECGSVLPDVGPFFSFCRTRLPNPGDQTVETRTYWHAHFYGQLLRLIDYFVQIVKNNGI